MTTCFINQSVCGRAAGQPVCAECGMDERVVFPSEADREAAQAAALVRFTALQEAVKPPPSPEPPKPPTFPEPPAQPPKQPELEPPVTPGPEKKGVNRLGVGVLVLALLGGGWWWKDQQDQRLQLAEERAAQQAQAAEQARRQSEAEKTRADEAQAQRVAAEKAQAQIIEQARREREAQRQRADEAEARRVAAEIAQAKLAEQARRVGEAEKRIASAPEPTKPQTLAAEQSLGLTLADLNAAQKKELDLKGGVRVVSADSAAARAGLREGDVIVAVANTEVGNAKEFEAALARLDKTRPMSVLFRRGEWAQYAIIRPAN